MKILVCCGSGLGSSFMMEMNIKTVLRELKFEAEVEHTDLSSAAGVYADLYIATRDLAPQLSFAGNKVIALNSMIDLEELKQKLKAAL